MGANTALIVGDHRLLTYPLKFASMEHILEKSSVKRVAAAIDEHGCKGSIKILEDSARTALDAASALGIEVGQIASSLIFRLPSGGALLIITSGRHRVDTQMVATELGVENLNRVDASFVKEFSGFSIGGVSPLAWLNTPEVILIDTALNDYEVVWAAAGHPHAVYPTTFYELVHITSARPMRVSAE